MLKSIESLLSEQVSIRNDLKILSEELKTSTPLLSMHHQNDIEVAKKNFDQQVNCTQNTVSTKSSSEFEGSTQPKESIQLNVEKTAQEYKQPAILQTNLHKTENPVKESSPSTYFLSPEECSQVSIINEFIWFNFL